jgi:hypothetical protein
MKVLELPFRKKEKNPSIIQSNPQNFLFINIGEIIFFGGIL